VTGEAPSASRPPSQSSSPSQQPITGPTGGGDAQSGKLGPGTRVHHYELIRELGRGGMGSVYLARDVRLGRRVAIKFLHTDNQELAQRFILEARTTARCSHENIVILHEVDAFRGNPFMVLEYLQGKTLSDVIRDGKRLPAPRAVELIVPVVRALACAHEQGIVHRDLKPANVLITDGGTVKVLDFGIAKVLQGDKSAAEQVNEAKVATSLKRAAGEDPDTGELTRHGAIVGTLPFMAPEQWRTHIPVDHRTDLWAVGIILFRMLAGKHPLDPLTGNQLYVTGILEEPMPKLASAARDVPQGLAAVVDRCLAKKKEERFPDANALLRALEPFLPGRYTGEFAVAQDDSPYAGLSSFQEADAHRFFGRSREIAAMTQRITDRPLLGVVGGSGAGKSSFVRAGLIPALKRSGEAWESHVIRPGRNPLAALATLVAPLLSNTDSVDDELAEQRKIEARLREEPGYVGAVLRARARREKKRILVFVDQFEELYTLVADADERRAFTTCLSGIADDATAPTRVTLSIRSDFLDRVAEDQHFMAELSQGLFFLNAPDRDGLKEAIVQPAERAGYRFESPQIVDQMLEHLASTQGALPLLQFAATKLWELRDAARKLLTLQSYEAIGGIAGALASHADRVVSELSPQAKSLARALLLRLVTPERTRAVVSVDELRELSRDPREVQVLVDQLVQARLLTVQTGGASGNTVEIVHESLLHSWPTLRRWLEESQEDAAFLEQLRNAARQWNAMGRDADLLWRGEVVEEAQRFSKRYRGELPRVQAEFLQTVFAQHVKAARRKRALMVGAAGFLVLLLVAAGVALVVIRGAQRNAEQQADAAQKSAKMAQTAESEARQRLVEVQAKELERQAAAKRAEEARAAVAKKNEELAQALKRAEHAKYLARRAQRASERSARSARIARRKALDAAKQLETLLAHERDRAQKLEAQLGSPLIEELK
jgi:serine/threonine protein kinase